MLDAMLLALAAQAAPVTGPSVTGPSEGKPRVKAHLFEGMSEAQMCAELKTRAEQTRAPKPPITKQTTTADCRAKRMRRTIEIDATGEEFDTFILRFVMQARRNICNFERPSMKAFAARGWRYAYVFISATGDLRSAKVEC